MDLLPAFSPFPTMFLSFQKQRSSTTKKAFENILGNGHKLKLDWAKNLSFGKDLI